MHNVIALEFQGPDWKILENCDIIRIIFLLGGPKTRNRQNERVHVPCEIFLMHLREGRGFMCITPGNIYPNIKI